MSQSISLDLWKRYAKVWHDPKTSVPEEDDGMYLNSDDELADALETLAREKSSEDARSELELNEEPDEDTAQLIAALMNK